MQSHEIRRRFLEFFAAKGHQVVDSSSLVPANDPTLFFTNAGMVQFKETFLGQERRPYSRATTSQKCLRVSGKHNDLEVVGRTARHHTFFEMLGNFSFGDYFKAEAIDYAWELLTEVYKIDKDRLWITVFEEDDEAWGLWKARTNLPDHRIQRMGAEENFWSMGDTGPCGPCSEIHYDHGDAQGPAEPTGPASGSPRYVEIWNLVFMQYQREANGSLTPLPRPSIDTGAGLERLAAVLQGKFNNYDTDAFGPIMDRAAHLAGVRYGEDPEVDTALRVIADHARAAAFLVSDGVMPSNEERGYVLRRIMRRAIRWGVKIGIERPFLWEAADAVVDHMGEAWPILRERREFIADIVRTEEERFRETLDKGLALLEKEFATLDGAGSKTLAGQVAFRLHDTFGFPLDLTHLIAEERGYAVDDAGYHAAMEQQREAGRAAWKGSGEQAVSDAFHALQRAGISSTFTGYEADAGEGRILALIHEGERVPRLTEGQSGVVITDRSPFYGESGGQVGDTGTIGAGDGLFVVSDTRRPLTGLIAHHGQIEAGSLVEGQVVTLQVDASRRDQTRLNHTATHLLHAALREVLGEHVTQKGSLVDPGHLRFDFAHHKAMTAEELERVEDIVQAQISRNTAVIATERSLDEARAAGAMALFGEKYGQRVRTIDVPGFSLELCGGTHARRTGDIGLFRLLSESGVAAGVRRIEALTGSGSIQQVRAHEAALQEAAALVRSQPEELPQVLGKLLEERKAMARELEQARRELSRAKAGDLASQARNVGGIMVLAAEIDGDASALRDEADRLRDQLGSAVVVLGSRADGAVKLVVAVTKDLAGKRAHAGNLIREVAKLVGGGGGGRPDMAQAGGKNPDALPAALEQVYALVAAQA